MTCGGEESERKVEVERVGMRKWRRIVDTGGVKEEDYNIGSDSIGKDREGGG